MIPKLKKHFDKHGVDVGLYTLKWFFQCFLDRVPFELGLRLWDIFLMDGDRVLTCGAYSILKMHHKQLLAKKNMDDLLDYLQSSIPNDLTISNDKAIEIYQRCLEDLQRKKLDVAGDVGEDELPKKPFGLIENIVKPIPVRKEQRISMRLNRTPPMAQKELTDNSECESREEEDEDASSEKASASRVTVTSAASSSMANSPRNISRPLSSISNFSYASAIEDYNSSNKSTPLKMNGVSSSSNKSKSSTVHNSDYKVTSVGYGWYESKPEREEEEDEEGSMENGSVETVESVELMDTQIISVHQGPQGDYSTGYSEDYKVSFKTGKGVRINNERSGRTPPPPPARSLDPKPHPPLSSIIHSTTIPVVESSSSMGSSSHNGDKSIINRRETAVVSSARLSSSSSSRSAVKEHSKISPISDAPSWSSSSISIPSGGEAVRIHVPYSNSNDISTIPVSTTPVPVTPRSNFDTLKNDPNRIKIDISSK